MSAVANSIQSHEENTSLDHPDAPSWVEIIANEQQRTALKRKANSTATQEPRTKHKPP
jgi:hypothetical protein